MSKATSSNSSPVSKRVRAPKKKRIQKGGLADLTSSEENKGFVTRELLDGLSNQPRYVMAI